MRHSARDSLSGSCYVVTILVECVLTVIHLISEYKHIQSMLSFNRVTAVTVGRVIQTS